MPRPLTFGHPGDGGLGDRLLAAVLRGEKTATSSLAVEYLAGEPLPRRGEQLALTDHDGRVHGTVETVSVAIVPLDEVGDDVAQAEGEGFADAAAWRAAHVAFWAEVEDFVRADAGDPGWALRPSEPVVVHHFALVDAPTPAEALATRVGRPLALEAHELLAEGLADVAAVDRIVRGAGWTTGPFEGEDLVGLDVALRRAEEAHAAAYGEPRLRPSPLHARLVAGGRRGRASGRGWFEHAEGATLRPTDPPPPAPGGGARRLVVLTGDTMLAWELRGLAEEADWRVEEVMGDAVPWLIVDAGPAEEEGPPLQGAPQVLLCSQGALHERDPGGGSVGFLALPPLGGLVELTRQAGSTAAAAERAEAFFGALGLATAWVGDAAGLVLGRIVAQLVNEAAFALADAPDAQALDDALEAAGHPRGPLGWADEIGLHHVLALLEALRRTHGERYRAAPLLRRLVADGRLGMETGRGFYAYEEPHEAGPSGD